MVVATFLFLANRYIFKIAKITVEGGGRYTDEEILLAAGLSEGMELYSLPLGEIEREIKDNMPYVKSAKFTRIPPSTLKINISLEKDSLGIKLGGDYYILSENFKVLDKISPTEKSEEDIIRELRSNNIILFKTNTIAECYVGKKVQFEDNDVSDFLKDVMEAVEKNQIYGFIDEIDITNKFEVQMSYNERFLVKVGTFEDIGTKILTLTEMIKELPEDIKGEIERNDSKSWSVIPNSRIFE